MRKIFLLPILAYSINISAGVKINEPLCILYDKDNNEIGTRSTSIQKGMSKASFEAAGTYFLDCPMMKITVTDNPVPEPEIPTPEPEPVPVSNKIRLSWTPPTQNTDNSILTNLSGYKIYYGTSPDALSTVIETTENNITINNLAPNTYYLAVTAINDLGVESEMSNVSSKQVGE